MDDPRLVYLEKRKAVVAAQEVVDSLVSDIQVAAGWIEKWDTVLLDGEEAPSQSYGRPQSALTSEDWPTYGDFAAALMAWREARKAAEDAEKKLSDREGVEPLPEKPSERRDDPRSYHPRVYPRGGHRWRTARRR